jgi:hypothetical protein
MCGNEIAGQGEENQAIRKASPRERNGRKAKQYNS